MPVIAAKDLAALVGVSVAQISRWAGEGMPRVARGKYDKDQCMAWIHDRREDRQSTGKLTEQRIALTVEQTRRVQIENRVRLGELCETETVEQEVRRLFNAIRQPLDQLVSQARTADEMQRLETLRDDILAAWQSGVASLAGDIRRSDDPRADPV